MSEAAPTRDSCELEVTLPDGSDISVHVKKSWPLQKLIDVVCIAVGYKEDDSKLVGLYLRNELVDESTSFTRMCKHGVVLAFRNDMLHNILVTIDTHGLIETPQKDIYFPLLRRYRRGLILHEILNFLSKKLKTKVIADNATIKYYSKKHDDFVTVPVRTELESDVLEDIVAEPTIHIELSRMTETVRDVTFILPDGRKRSLIIKMDVPVSVAMLKSMFTEMFDLYEPTLYLPNSLGADDEVAFAKYFENPVDEDIITIVPSYMVPLKVLFTLPPFFVLSRFFVPIADELELEETGLIDVARLVRYLTNLSMSCTYLDQTSLRLVVFTKDGQTMPFRSSDKYIPFDNVARIHVHANPDESSTNMYVLHTLTGRKKVFKLKFPLQKEDLNEKAFSIAPPLFSEKPPLIPKNPEYRFLHFNIRREPVDLFPSGVETVTEPFVNENIFVFIKNQRPPTPGGRKKSAKAKRQRSVYRHVPPLQQQKRKRSKSARRKRTYRSKSKQRR